MTAAAPKFEGKIKILNDYKYDAVNEQTELLWRCDICGELFHRKNGLPCRCSSCHAPQNEISLIEED